MHAGIDAHALAGHIARHGARQEHTSCAISSAVETTFSGNFAATASRTCLARTSPHPLGVPKRIDVVGADCVDADAEGQNLHRDQG